MKSFVTEVLIIALLCLLDLFKVASSDQRPMDIIDHFIGLAEPNNDDIAKRNSIVDGGVFVPYKSTTIVYKSRLVPVTYGFVIKKETLKDNPALYKLGVKLLDEKVEPTSKQMRVDGKKIELETMTDSLSKIHEQQQLDAKSNCVKGSKVLRLLAKLGRDISKIEREILAQNQSVKSKEDLFIAKSLKKKEGKKLRPQQEAHVSGHKGVFEKVLDTKSKKPYKQNILKNLSRYRQCRRSHTKKKCAVLFLRKHFHSERQEGRRPERHKTAHNNKRHKKHEPNKERNLKYNNRRKTKHSNKHNNNENLDKNNNNKKSKHPLKNNNSKKRDGHGSDKQSYVNTNLTKHEPRKQHRNKHHVKPAIKNRKHLLRLKSYEKSSQ